MKIKQLLIEYDDNNKYLADLNLDKFTKIKAWIFGYLLALMIVFSPIIITSHCFIYNFYFELIVLVLALLIVLFLSLGEIFYHKLLIYFSKTELKKSLKITHIFDILMYLLICLICYVVILLLF